VLAVSARMRMLAGDDEGAIRIADEALAIAEALELDELRAHALTTRGSSQAAPHDGVADVEEALRIARAMNSPIAGAIANNVAVLASRSGDLRRAAELHEDAIELAQRIGDVDSYRFTTGNLVFQYFFAGRWDETVALADAFVRECESSPHYMEGGVRGVRSYIRLARGDLTGAMEDAEIALARAREIKDPQRLIPSLFGSARTHLAAGDQEAARRLAKEGLAEIREHTGLAGMLGQITFVADELDITSEMVGILEDEQESFWRDTARASVSGDHALARKLYLDAGAPALAAEESLLAGDSLMRAGELDNGRAYLEEAFAFYRSVGATVFAERAERLLGSSYSESA
jgi:tetratricopeptide (TPR) repeat protein